MIELLQKFSAISYEEFDGYYVIKVPSEYDLDYLDYALIFANGGASIGDIIAFEDLDDDTLLYLVMQGEVCETAIRYSLAWKAVQTIFNFRLMTAYSG
ncbi:hypothetical protein RMR21_009680 [Agrobacterium sp. rho-8.1]|nr:hypothetical protein [Agrobacterium sp. rho-8.1]